MWLAARTGECLWPWFTAYLALALDYVQVVTCNLHSHNPVLCGLTPGPAPIHINLNFDKMGLWLGNTHTHTHHIHRQQATCGHGYVINQATIRVYRTPPPPPLHHDQWQATLATCARVCLILFHLSVQST